MTAHDLSGMSLAQLKELQENVAIAIFENEQRLKKEARYALEKKARELGFDLDELIQGPKNSRKGRKVIPKYMDPENPSNTWSGRGRKPKWIQSYLSMGKNIEDFKI